jgi:hypothetical protein
MMTVRKKPTRVKPARTARLLPYHEPRCAGILAIGMGKSEPVYYYCRPLPTDFGEGAWDLEKFITQQRGEGDAVYHVLLDGLKSTCDCMGFLHHGHCKHLDSVRELYAAGELKPAPKVRMYRSTADFAANDPEGYEAMMREFPERPWPPADEEAEAERRYCGEE